MFRSNKKSNVWVLIVLITLIWGYAWVLMKESLQFMGPFSFSSLRFGTGSIMMLMLVFVMRVGIPPKTQWRHLIMVGLLQTTIVFSLVMYGLRFVDAGKSSVLLYSMPIWSSLLAAKVLKEPLTKVKLLGLGMGMVGLLTILGWDIWVEQNLKAIFGELLIILAAISWGVSNVYYRLKLQNVPRLQVSAYQMLFGTLGLIIATIMMEWGKPISITSMSMYYILFTGILASALCFTVWFYILSIIDMVTATLSTLLVPIFAMLFGSVFLDEKLTIGIIIGTVLILGGIFVAQMFKGDVEYKGLDET
ncbi:DMT family transporter [Aquibacillus sp. 3ASR75-11]|uniref:DMT family transporter n=1 Tax=Terrihalobacillus insolitus TaxID=2950438 RepID=A0A9X3WQ71_9BACI|nr:DMT family transporter [Terrihalobacillus insolitus]MDC3412112.1 DMT family transporter [Terrihalobacillus insolitus]MDC3423195.1 DMT family transporter [Terrihalobacillus insolitus]